MLKFFLFVAITLLRAVGFVIREIVVKVGDIFIPPPQYAQGFGGATYAQNRQPAPVNTVLPAVKVSSKEQAATVGNSVQVAERDPLVLRTPQELMPEQGQLIGRDVPSVSSRVLTVALEADGGLPIGTAWLYLFDRDESGAPLHKARRVLKFSNRALARLVCGADESRYFFKDVEYIPENGTREITTQFISEIKALLDRKQGFAKVEKHRVQKEQLAVKPKELEVAAKPTPEPVSVPVTEPVVKPIEVVPARPVNRNVKGTAYEGCVVSVGMTEKNGRDGAYQTFCLTINDGQREVPLNGTEIQRQVNDMKIRIGEKIRVVDMGKSTLDVPGAAKPWMKNLFQITRMEAH